MNRREPLRLTVKKHLSRDVNEQNAELFERGKHSDNATRVAFKVECVGVFLSLLTLVDLFIKWGHTILIIK